MSQALLSFASPCTYHCKPRHYIVSVISDLRHSLWAAVKANPSDFTSWTTLLQIVEQNVRDRGVLCVCVRACVCVILMMSLAMYSPFHTVYPGPLVVGEVCEVTERRKKHPARVHATGLYLHAHVHVLVASF